MNCLEFRQQVLTDPYHRETAALEHLDTCDQCTRFLDEIMELDGNIKQSLQVDVPEGLAARVLLAQSLAPGKKPARKTNNWAPVALAASILVAVSAFLFFDTDSGEPLLVDVLPAYSAPMLAHAAHQPHEFYGSEHRAIGPEQIQSLMGKFNLTASLENVVYAAVCPVDGETAAHLVIKDGTDQYTVMLLPERSPTKMLTISDELWRGYVSPHPAGALAVLAESDDEHAIQRIREVTDKLQSAIYLSAEI